MVRELLILSLVLTFAFHSRATTQDVAKTLLREWTTTGMWLEHGSTGSPVVPPEEMRRKLKPILEALDVSDSY